MHAGRQMIKTPQTCTGMMLAMWPSMRTSLSVLALVTCAALPETARADCAATAGYQSGVNGNTVQILFEASSRTCPDASGLLRQNEATGQVDLLASYCTMSTIPGFAYGQVYTDECVPPGTYRYGLALPFSCDEAGCSGTLPFFREVTVTSPLPQGCTPAAADPGPTTTNEVPPWVVQGQVQPKESCPGHGGCACDTARAKVVSMNASALSLGVLVMALAARRKRNRA